jgi:hypothetical protein
MLQFNLPVRTGLNHTVDIEIGGQASTNQAENKRFVFNYDDPIVYPIKIGNWTRQRGNNNFPGENGRYYAPTTGCANPASEMADPEDPEDLPKKRGCVGAAHIIIKGENFGCCTHSEREIDIYGSYASDCKSHTINGVTVNNGPPCSLLVTNEKGVTSYINHPENTPRLVLTDENGLVQPMKIKSFGHYEIKAELPEGTGKSVISVEVGPPGTSSLTEESSSPKTYKTAGKIAFSYSKPALAETKFGLEISGSDISNSFDATGSSKYGTLDGEKDTQWKLFLFGDNFGASQSPTHIEVLAGYFNNGAEDWKNCSEPTWHSASYHSAGFPYLSCYPPAVTVGRKKMADHHWFQFSIDSKHDPRPPRDGQVPTDVLRVDGRVLRQVLELQHRRRPRQPHHAGQLLWHLRRLDSSVEGGEASHGRRDRGTGGSFWVFHLASERMREWRLQQTLVQRPAAAGEWDFYGARQKTVPPNGERVQILPPRMER